ncbi:MAG TPA: LysR substrate-binding domain-containing protein [Alphaproteobacteria bacterium]|jgi:LysR family glycine cleavage system transcriptional activator|nr:LysR substrate-binding domain-containing protein [Alphaproteobacteria bacterium]
MSRTKERRSLPPLNALRAFEAVARSLSFTRAAEELLVTQSAVSRQVKNLEDILGVSLLRRKANLELTDEGKRLLPVLTDAFDRIDVVVAGFKRQSRKPPLTLSLPPTFARRLVLPLLPEFQKQHPDLEIRIETPPVNVDFRNSGHDLAIFFGEVEAHGPSGAEMIVDLLMSDQFAPLASPKLAKTAAWPDLATMAAKAQLLHIRQGNDPWFDWRLFLRQTGLPNVRVERGLVLETADQAVQSACSGGGVALADPRLFQEEIDQKRLTPLFDVTVNSGRYYYLLSRAEEIEIPRIAAFRAWITRHFAGA